MSLINSRNGDYQDLLNNGGVVSSLTGTKISTPEQAQHLTA